MQERELTYDEEERVKQFSPPLLQMLITLLADTGLRVKKEALTLKWSEVSIDTVPACIRIVDSKSAAGVRRVWLTNHCRKALARWRELLGPEFSPFVFPSPRNPAAHFVDYKTAWRTAAKKAGLGRSASLRPSFNIRKPGKYVPRDRADGCPPAWTCQHSNSANVRSTLRRQH
jgi:integrase